MMFKKCVKVLLMVQNPLHAELLGRMLAGFSESTYNVEWVESVSNGIKRLSKGDIDVVLLDFVLVKRSGESIFAKIHAQITDIPIVVFRILDEKKIVVSSMHLGEDSSLLDEQRYCTLLKRFLCFAAEMRKSKEEIAKDHRHFEGLLKKYTAELTRKNTKLKQEITERKQTEMKLRSMASELSLAEERERRRIAAGLHDDIGQILYITKMKIETVQNDVSSVDLTILLGEVIENIDQAIQRTRSLIFELSPPVLYELGFESALKSLTEQVNQQYDIFTQYVDDEKPKPLDDEISILLFQSVRELLANATKHSKANKVKVSTRREGNNIRIDIEDDGIGFDVSEIGSSLDNKKGFGLFSIRERLDCIGGSLELTSKPSVGTRVSLITSLKEN